MGGVIAKCSRQLLLPYIGVAVVTCVLWALFKDNVDIAITNFLLGATVQNDKIIGLGPAWFFLALFFCRIFYRLLAQFIQNQGWLTVVILIISSGVVLINRKFTLYSVPYQITQGAVSMFYYHAGVLLMQSRAEFHSNVRAAKIIRQLLVPAALLLSALCISIYKLQSKSMNLSALDFPCFPIDYFNAALLSLSLYLVVVHYVRKGVGSMPRFLAWIGENSIVIYCIHCIEYHFTIHPIAQLVDDTFGAGNVALYSSMRLINPIVQIAICVLGLYIYQNMKLKYKHKISQ